MPYQDCCKNGHPWTPENTKRQNKKLTKRRCRTCSNIEQNKLTARVKAETIAAYGNRCACCGETEIAFLSIDHKFGGGNEHRRSLKRIGGKAFYYWLKRQGYPQDDYQVLCHNCNQAKSAYGICPHQAELPFAEAA